MCQQSTRNACLIAGSDTHHLWSTTMRFAKALKLFLVSIIGGAAAIALLTVATVKFAAVEAEATPAIGKGKACTTCHTSSKPSKSDVKK
jgi:hypothetical protein